MSLARLAPTGLSLSLTLTVAAGAFGAPISLFVLSDSLSDTGDIAIGTGGMYPVSPPYDPMRFTNRAPVAIAVPSLTRSVMLAAKRP